VLPSDPAYSESEWPAPRDAVIALLARLTPNAWYAVDNLTAAIIGGSRRPRARRPLGPTARAAPGRRLRQAHHDTRLLAELLQTALVWLGLLTPGLATEGQRPALQLTPVGAWLAGLTPEPALPAPAIEVEPSLRLLVYGVDAALLWQVLAFAAPAQLDRVSLFQLSRASILRGLGVGLTAAAMLAALEQAARHGVPQNVAYAIHDWARLTGHARLHHALILTFDDERHRDEALALPHLRALQPEPLSHARLAIPINDAAAEQRARQTLAALGFEHQAEQA
jgi:hypothetical protein